MWLHEFEQAKITYFFSVVRLLFFSRAKHVKKLHLDNVS